MMFLLLATSFFEWERMVPPDEPNSSMTKIEILKLNEDALMRRSFISTGQKIINRLEKEFGEEVMEIFYECTGILQNIHSRFADLDQEFFKDVLFLVEQFAQGKVSLENDNFKINDKSSLEYIKFAINHMKNDKVAIEELKEMLNKM